MTARADFQALNLVPRDNRLLIDQDRVSGHGIGDDIANTMHIHPTLPESINSAAGGVHKPS